MRQNAGKAFAEKAVGHEYHGDNRHRPAKVSPAGLHQKKNEGKGENLVQQEQVVNEGNPLHDSH